MKIQERTALKEVVLGYFTGLQRSGVPDPSFAVSYLAESATISRSVSKVRDFHRSSIGLERFAETGRSDRVIMLDLKLVHSYVLVDEVYGPALREDVYEGEALLVRDADSWKVASFTRRGRSSLDSIFVRPEGRSDKSGIDIDVRKVVLGKKETLLVVAIANTGERTVEMGPVSIRSGLRFATGYVEQGLTLRRHEHSVALLACDSSFPLRTKKMTLRFLERFDDREDLHDVMVSLGQAGRSILLADFPELSRSEMR